MYLLLRASKGIIETKPSNNDIDKISFKISNEFFEMGKPFAMKHNRDGVQSSNSFLYQTKFKEGLKLCFRSIIISYFVISRFITFPTELA